MNPPSLPPVSRSRGRRTDAARRSGFTLLETVTGLAFLTTALLGLGTVLVMSYRAQDTAEEQTLVNRRIQRLFEEIRSADFDEAASTFQGHDFTIDGLPSRGRVTILLDETDTSPAAVAMGFPRDLDGDGASDTTNVADSYVLLALYVDVAWSGTDGVQNDRFYAFLSDEN